MGNKMKPQPMPTPALVASRKQPTLPLTRNPLRTMQQKVQRAIHTIIAPWRQPTPRRAIAPPELTATSAILIPPTQPAELPLRLGIAGTTMGLAVVGNLFWSPLRLITLPLTFGNALFFYRDSYRALQGKGRLSSNLLDALYVTALVVQGNALIGALRVSTSTLGQYLETQARTNNTTANQVDANQVDASQADASQVDGGPATAAEKFNAQMTLPMVGLSAITVPLLGVNPGIAVLGQMPGYKMRYLGPMTMLNFRYLVEQEGIVLPDSLAIEPLSRVDTLLFDIEIEQLRRPEVAAMLQSLKQLGFTLGLLVDETHQATHPAPPPGTMDRLFSISDPSEKSAVIAQWQQAGNVVCWVGMARTDSPTLAAVESTQKQANFIIYLRDAEKPVSASVSTPADACVTLTFAQLPQLLAYSQHFAASYRNNLWLATAAPLVNLASIYFLHWGLVASTLLGTGVMFAGLVNTTLPLFQPKSLAAETNLTQKQRGAPAEA